MCGLNLRSGGISRQVCALDSECILQYITIGGIFPLSSLWNNNLIWNDGEPYGWKSLTGIRCETG